MARPPNTARLPKELDALLSSTGERSDDLRRTLHRLLNALPTLEHPAVLSHFQQLLPQLRLLQERGADARADALFASHVCLPAELDGVQDHVAMMPHLLSTRLDKEMEDELLALEAEAAAAAAAAGEGGDGAAGRVNGAAAGAAGGSGEPPTSADAIRRHNAALSAAHEHLAQASLALDLQGAAAVQQQRAAAVDAAAALAARGMPAAAPAPRGAHSRPPAAPAAAGGNGRKRVREG